MSTRFAADEELGIGATPVFVDDSGRRRERVRIAGRVVVVAFAMYGVLVAIALTGSLSLPVVHLGEVGGLPARVRQSALGRTSQRTPLPAALAPARAPSGGLIGRVVSPTLPGRAGAGRHAFPVVSAATTTTASSVPAANHGKSQKFVTTVPPTTAPSPVTSTSTPHPPTTRQGHGPPTSVPGKGKGP
jgi:hypothetical protein